jgi:hypothetical protein
MLYFGTNLILKREQKQRRNIPLGVANKTKRTPSTTGRLANAGDDVGIRRLLQQTSIPGHIRVAYLREPSFFRRLAI